MHRSLPLSRDGTAPGYQRVFLTPIKEMKSSQSLTSDRLLNARRMRRGMFRAVM
jgi:hypothetical protein